MTTENKPEIGRESNGQLFWSELLPTESRFPRFNRWINRVADKATFLERSARSERRQLSRYMNQPESELLRIYNIIAYMPVFVMIDGVRFIYNTEASIAESMARLTGGRRRLIHF